MKNHKNIKKKCLYEVLLRDKTEHSGRRIRAFITEQRYLRHVVFSLCAIVCKCLCVCVCVRSSIYVCMSLAFGVWARMTNVVIIPSASGFPNSLFISKIHKVSFTNKQQNSTNQGPRMGKN